MSERLPYEEQLPHQWDNLPLPDINLAWADMNRRLEEEDDNKPAAWWRSGCMLWGFLLLGLIGAGWWLLQPGKKSNGKKENDITTVIGKKDDTSTTTVTTGPVPLTGDRQDEEPKQTITGRNTSTDSNYSIQNDHTGKPPAKTIISKITSGETVIKTKKKLRVKTNNRTGEVKDNDPGHEKPTISITDKPGETAVVPGKNVDKSRDDTISVAKYNLKTDSVNTVAKPDLVKKTSPEKDTTVANPVLKVDSVRKKLHYFSMGIALHQQLPVAGQKSTPYNSLGRTGSLRDYIPSLYFRWNRKDKWFLQAEFRYGAPQYTKEFIYKQNSVPIQGTNSFFVTSSTLKKTYYHQLPLTFNYRVLPGWFFGAGLQWNKFNSAIIEEELVRRTPGSSQDSAISKFSRKEKKDSAYQFTKNYFLGVVETEYQWKRLSLGARYTYGLQPYIRFTLPGGTQQQRSTALQIFLRYQLKRTKEK